MYDNIIETLEFGPNDRVLVVPEDSPQCPRGNDEHMLTGFVKILGRGDSRLNDVPAVHDDLVRIEEAYTRFDQQVYPGPIHHAGWPDAEEVVERWARIFHGLAVEYDSEHGGFWFVAGADAATAATPVDTYSRALFYDNWPAMARGSAEHLAKQAEVIKQERETYRQWADGEIVGLVHEQLTLWGKLSSDGGTLLQGEGTTREEWQEVDSVWGFYPDSDEAYRDDANAHFGLPKPEPEGPTKLASQLSVLQALEKLW